MNDVVGPNNVSDQIYVLERSSAGRFDWIDTWECSGKIPAIGERLTLAIHSMEEGDGAAVQEVIERHYVRYIDEATDDEFYAWFVIVKTIEMDGIADLAEAVGKVFRHEFRDVLSPRQKAETPVPVDSEKFSSSRRTGRRKKRSSPAEPRDDLKHWQRQQEERDKHRPIHKLNAPQMRALRFMIDHPELQTSDLIPNAAEKTMEALAKVGCLRPGGKDYSGMREWHVTDEGRAEVQREDTYKNWAFE